MAWSSSTRSPLWKEETYEKDTCLRIDNDTGFYWYEFEESVNMKASQDIISNNRDSSMKGSGLITIFLIQFRSLGGCKESSGVFQRTKECMIAYKSIDRVE